MAVSRGRARALLGLASACWRSVRRLARTIHGRTTARYPSAPPTRAQAAPYPQVGTRATSRTTRTAAPAVAAVVAAAVPAPEHRRRGPERRDCDAGGEKKETEGFRGSRVGRAQREGHDERSRDRPDGHDGGREDREAGRHRAEEPEELVARLHPRSRQLGEGGEIERVADLLHDLRQPQGRAVRPDLRRRAEVPEQDEIEASRQHLQRRPTAL